MFYETSTDDLFQTLESYGYGGLADFSIERGGITAKSEVRTVATNFNPGDPSFFYTSNQQPLRDPTKIFCVVPSNDVSGDHPVSISASIHCCMN